MTEPVIPSLDDPFHTVDEVAGIFSVTAYTVREWLKEGLLHGIKLPSGGWRIQHSEMVRFANAKYGEKSG